jgi:hypothetical protein
MLSREQLRRRLAGPIARDLDAALEGAEFEVAGFWRGGNADSYLLRTHGGQPRWVLKVTTGQNLVRYEAAILAQAPRLRSGAPMFPRLLAVLGDDAALLLEFVPARSVRTVLRRGKATPALAANMAAALKDFHDQFEVAFGDLHPSNVLVRRDASIVFVDPAGPGWRESDQAQPLLVQDLAYYTHLTAGQLARDILASPRGAGRLLELNARLIAAALDDEQGVTTLGEIEAATFALLPRISGKWRRDRVRLAVARVAMAFVFWRAQQLVAARGLVWGPA